MKRKPHLEMCIRCGELPRPRMARWEDGERYWYECKCMKTRPQRKLLFARKAWNQAQAALDDLKEELT